MARQQMYSETPPSTPDLQQGPGFGASELHRIRTDGAHAGHRQQDQLPTPITPGSRVPFTTVSKEHLSKTGRNLQYELLLAELHLSGEQVAVDLESQVGEGSNSKVYRCSVVDGSGRQTAVAKVPITPKKNAVMERELALLARIHSERAAVRLNFVGIYGAYDMDGRTSLLLEAMDCDLHSYIDAHGDTSGAVAIGQEPWWRLVQCLVESLQLMKQLQIVHCDLKTSNVLYDVRNGVFKVCDLSSAKTQDEASPESDTTLQFLAPELVQVQNRGAHSFGTDLYSAGLVLLHAATGRQPYNDYICGSLFQLINMIKKNYVLEALDSGSCHVLKANPEVFGVVRQIVVDRVALEELRWPGAGAGPGAGPGAEGV